MRKMTLPFFLVGAVLMMVIPVPAMVLDMLLVVNISIAIMILLGTIFLEDVLDMSVFPSLLLVTTLTRLALNVSSTRLILLNGFAGKVIESFGNFVVGGSIVVGLVVFLILVVIQFVVVTNGAGRVAEVAARFTLDAMPGKQMAIDADLASGLIDHDQARALRRRAAKEADFYGAMDGASKFVKGDAIAAIVIVLINLIGGFAIGMGMHGMDFGTAIKTYSLLSVGDGLVSQLPALLISIATGLLVTRVGGDGSLGGELTAQLFARRDAMKIAGGVAMGMAILPGLPKLPFLLVGGLLFFFGGAKPKEPAETGPAVPVLSASSDDPEALAGEMRVEPLELHLAYDILDLIDPQAGGDLLPRVKALRKQIAVELGYVMPPVGTREDVSLEPTQYRIMLHGVEVGQGSAPRGRVLTLPFDDGRGLAALGGTEGVEPVFGLKVWWVPEERRAEASALGATVVDRPSVVVTHLAEIARRHAADLLSRQDVSQLVDWLRQDQPLLAKEVGSDHLPLSLLHAVFRRLLEEQVPVRDTARIVEAVAARATQTRSVDHLASAARAAVGGAIVNAAAGGGELSVMTLDPVRETALMEALREVDGELRLAIDPAVAQAVAEDVRAALSGAGLDSFAILTSQALRRPLQRLLAAAGVEVRVLAYAEVPPHVKLTMKGVLSHGAQATAIL
jgi:flagellar biosynthesis protein FlhA